MVKFAEKTIRYRSGSLTLAGVILLPTGGPNPGVVIIHGSGKSDRRSKWYQEIARHLAGHGIAVLLPDKRGCNESEGDWTTADFQDLAADSIAGIEALCTQEDVDQKRVGLIGVSQGGWIAPLAARMRQVAFVISLSGASVTPRDQLRYEHESALRGKSLPTVFSDVSFPFAELLLKRRWHRWSDVRNFDPMPLWETLTTPALLIFGDKDQNVPVQESLQRLDPLLKKKKQQEFLVKVFYGSGHGLLEPKGNNLRQDFLDLLTEWIKSR